MIGATVDVVATMLEFSQPADAVLSNYFRNNRQLGSRERAFVADTAYAVLRRKRFVEGLCGEKDSPRHLVLAAWNQTLAAPPRFVSSSPSISATRLAPVAT